MVSLPGLGTFTDADGLVSLQRTSDGRFVRGEDGVVEIRTMADRKVEFVGFRGHTIAGVRSALGYPAYYPVAPVELRTPVEAVLMDLDGTSVHSEHFWIWIIERTTATLLGDASFALEQADVPFVAGHSVSEHLQYCIDKYCPGRPSKRRGASTSITRVARCTRSWKGGAVRMRSCLHRDSRSSCSRSRPGTSASRW